MYPRSSSTSSSSRRRPARLRAVAAICGWMLLALVLIEIGLQLAFPMPADRREQPGALAQYFFYGTSTPGKLAYMIGPTEATSAEIIGAGWIDTTCRQPPPAPPPGQTGVTIYGMSFSNHVAAQLRTLDPSLAVTTYAGPGAPANHSYACYQMLRASGGDPNPVQIFGVLASAVPRLLTLGGMTTSFEWPAPFTYPRYRLVNGRLESEQPIVRSPGDLRDATKWRAYLDQLKASDRFYNYGAMEAQWADRSIFLRLLRRARAQAFEREQTAALVNDGHNFLPNPEIGPVLAAMLVDFARTARADGKLPIVILFQDQGTGVDSLERLVGPALRRNGVPTVLSREVAPNTDPRNFVPDGHFTPAVDRRIAELVRDRIDAAAGAGGDGALPPRAAPAPARYSAAGR